MSDNARIASAKWAKLTGRCPQHAGSNARLTADDGRAARPLQAGQTSAMRSAGPWGRAAGMPRCGAGWMRS